MIYFLSMNFDRLYLAKRVPFELLGIYGIARSLSELLGMLTARLGGVLVFPLVASASHMGREELRAQLAPIRLKFLMAAALGFSLLAATGDLIIRLLYDERYHAAAWMLPVLVIGTWFAVMTNLNESMLLGLGKPSYSAIGNCVKFGGLLVGLPFGFAAYGILGAVVVVAMSELGRYCPVLVGQRREHFSFAFQDLLGTFVVLGLVGLWELLRLGLELGTSFDQIPAGY